MDVRSPSLATRLAGALALGAVCLAAGRLALLPRLAETAPADWAPLAGLDLALVLAVFAALGLLLRSRVLRPVRALRDAAERRAGGERGVRVELPGDDDLAALARAGNAAATALDDSHDRLESVIQSISDGFMEWEIATDRLRFSRRFRELVGIAGIDPGDESCPYAVFEDALHPDDRAATFAAMQAHLESGTPYFVEYRLRGAAGAWRWFESRATTIRDAAGRPVRVIGSVTDIDDRKRAEEAARAWTSEVEQARDRISEQARTLAALNQDLAQARDQALEAARAKAAFLTNMSHEIRTPMNAVIGMTAILLEGELPAEQREAAETIRAAGDQLLGIVNAILDFSGLEEGGLQIVTSDFDVRTLVQECAARIRPDAERKGLQVESRIDADVPALVSTDAGRLRQVLGHLLANAVKFTQRGSVSVTLSAEPEAEGQTRLRFAVTDTGIGVDERLRARLFQPFVQADDSDARRYGGTGLGLAICRRLVEMLGGTLSVESAAGRGSSFRFHVRAGVRQLAAPLTLASAELRGLRALVVGGREAGVLRAQLEGLGVEVESVQDAEQALARARIAAGEARGFDLAFLEAGVASEEAFVLAGRLGEEPGVGAIRSFLLTSGFSRRMAERARAAGFAGQLALPARQSHLHDTILASLPARNAPPAEPAALRGRARVLVAEDNPVNQKLARRLLEKLGCEVVLVENGLDAVRAMASGEYDVVLMDCQMPRMDGFEATREIRRREAPGRHVPIIAVTANAMPGDRERCLEAGMDDYVPKPVKREVLTHTVRRWLGMTDRGEEACSA